MTKISYSKDDLLRLNQNCETPPEGADATFQKLTKNHYKILSSLLSYTTCKPTKDWFPNNDDDNGPSSSPILVC